MHWMSRPMVSNIVLYLADTTRCALVLMGAMRSPSACASQGFEDRLISWSSTKNSSFEANPHTKWDSRNVLRFSEFLREGMQVCLHSLGEASAPVSDAVVATPQRIMRYV